MALKSKPPRNQELLAKRRAEEETRGVPNVWRRGFQNLRLYGILVGMCWTPNRLRKERRLSWLKVNAGLYQALFQ